MRPTTTNISANIPAFLSKLWKMVNDPETDHLISWSPGGHNFVIQNQAQFWYNLLPIYYKHNNMSSFIRQLNMYGFHKISAENGGLECDKDEIKFFHPFFQQGQPNLLKHIKRKIASNKTSATTNEDNKVNNVDQIAKVLVDVKQLRGRQKSVDNQLAAMKQENAALWRELALLRQKHMKQQQIVNKLIHFLVTIVQPSRSGLGGLGVKRRYPLMINDGRYPAKAAKPDTDVTCDGPTIHELDTEAALSDPMHVTDVRVDDGDSNEIADQTCEAASPPSPGNTLIDNSNGLLDILVEEDADNPPEDDLNSELLLESNQQLEDSELNASNNENSAVADLLAETDMDPGISSAQFPLKDDDLEQVMTDKDIFQAANEYIDLNKLRNAQQMDPARNVLNQGVQEAIISNLMSETLEAEKCDDNKSKEQDNSSSKNLTVATRTFPDLNTMKLSTANDLDNHLESTQDELENIKEMLFDGYSLDANALLGLFNPEDSFPMDVTALSLPDNNKDSSSSKYDPMMSGSELMSYPNPPFMLDFDNLFEDTSDTVLDNSDTALNINDLHEDLTTPVVVKKEPTYPTTK